jgi:hypothetical protein
MTKLQKIKTVLAYIALLLAQFLIEYCAMVLLILYWPNVGSWFGELNHLRLFLSLSGVVSLLLIFEALKEGKRN